MAHCLFVCLFLEWKKSHLVYNKICNVSLSWYSFQVKMHLCQVSSFVIDADLDGTDYVSTHFVILCFNRFTQSTYAKNGTKYMTCNQVSDYEMLSSNICLWIFFYYILGRCLWQLPGSSEFIKYGTHLKWYDMQKSLFSIIKCISILSKA